MRLFENLNRLGVNYVAERGVCRLEACPPDDLLTEDGTYKHEADEVFTNDLDEEAKQFLDTHPEGSGGGYVCWVEFKQEKAWFDENGDNEWKLG